MKKTTMHNCRLEVSREELLKLIAEHCPESDLPAKPSIRWHDGIRKLIIEWNSADTQSWDCATAKPEAPEPHASPDPEVWDAVRPLRKDDFFITGDGFVCRALVPVSLPTDSTDQE